MAVVQVGGSAVTATSTRNRGGAAKMAGGNPTSGLVDAVALTPAARTRNHVYKGQHSGATSALLGDGVSLTSVADNGSGYCRFTLASHGLTVGTALSVSGATAASLNTVHIITAVDTNTFDTDIAYTASGTAGTYKLGRGNFATMTKGKYVAKKLTEELAGVANTVLVTGASDFGQRRSINKFEAVRNTFLHSWTWTSTGEGVLAYTYTKNNSTTGLYDIADATDDPTTGDNAAMPTRAVPGELVYRHGSNTPVQANYRAKTG